MSAAYVILVASGGYLARSLPWIEEIGEAWSTSCYWTVAIVSVVHCGPDVPAAPLVHFFYSQWTTIWLALMFLPVAEWYYVAIAVVCWAPIIFFAYAAWRLLDNWLLKPR